MNSTLRPLACAFLGLATVACSGTTHQNVDVKPATQPATSAAQSDNLHAFTVESLDGKPVALSDYRGKVVLIVNTASKCGYTPQYAGLEKLHEKYASRGFSVLGFPCNQFKNQEPGDAAQIREFCDSNYHVTFPLFAKVNVKAGDDQAPLYAWLGKASGNLPTWNFCKYLVGKDGRVIQFWASKTTPEDAEVAAAIEKALAAG